MCADPNPSAMLLLLLLLLLCVCSILPPPRRRDDVSISAADLLNIRGMPGSITEAGVRGNLHVALAYMESWLRCVWGGGEGGMNSFARVCDTVEKQICQACMLCSSRAPTIGFATARTCCSSLDPSWP
jgi:hypothetical protein